MTQRRKEQLIRRLQLVSDDMERDAKTLDGMPFNGKSVGTQFGNQCAAIRGLSETLKELLEEDG